MSELSAIVEKATADFNKEVGADTGEGETAPDEVILPDNGEKETAAEREAEEPVTNQTLFGLNAQEQANALQLFSALKDPGQKRQIIEAMVKLEGLELASKKEQTAVVSEVKDDIMSVLSGELGPELDFLTPKLGAALEKIISKKLNESLAPVHQDIQKREENRIVSETQTAFDGLNKQFYNNKGIPEGMMGEMSKVMDIFKPAPGMTTQAYIDSVYDMASGRQNRGNGRPSTEGRTDRNRTDAASRLVSGGVKSQTQGQTVKAANESARSLKEIVAGNLDKILSEQKEK